MRESSRMSEMVRCRQCGATFPYEPAGRVQASPGPAMLEFEAKRRELRQKELEAGQVQSEGRQPAASLGDPEIPRLMGTWIRADEDCSLPERGPIAPTPREEVIAPQPKKPVDRARHAAYMRSWRQRQALRKLLGEA
jgi:hypothetical protein